MPDGSVWRAGLPPLLLALILFLYLSASRPNEPPQSLRCGNTIIMAISYTHTHTRAESSRFQTGHNTQAAASAERKELKSC